MGVVVVAAASILFLIGKIDASLSIPTRGTKKQVIRLCECNIKLKRHLNVLHEILRCGLREKYMGESVIPES